MIYSDKKRAELSFYEFFKQCWTSIESSAYIDNWHIKAIAEHLQACFYRDITHLLINVPPRTSKSSLVSVAFPTWVWLHDAGETFYSASVDKKLSMYAADKSRDLIRSEWYQGNWGNRFSLSRKNDAKSFYVNDRKGYRMSTSVRSRIVGRGGSIQLSDDLNEIDEGECQRDATRVWWDQRWYSRTAAYGRTVKIVVQQRTHENDIAGHILTNEADKWVTLILPNEFEESKKCTTYINNKKFWEDPRTNDGQLLSSQTIGEKETKEIKIRLGSYGYAGQYQQLPSPAEGGIIKKAWFKWWDKPALSKYDHIIQSWDTAITDSPTSAYSACTTWGVFYDDNNIGNVILLSMWRGRVNFPALFDRAQRLERNYLDITDEKPKLYSRQLVDMVLVEAKATGDPLIQTLRRAGVRAIPYQPKGDKEGRVQRISHFIEGGLVWLPTKAPNYDQLLPWADEFLGAVATFPNADSRDLVDTMSQVLGKLRDTNFLDHPKDEKKIEKSIINRQLY